MGSGRVAADMLANSPKVHFLFLTQIAILLNKATSMAPWRNRGAENEHSGGHAGTFSPGLDSLFGVCRSSTLFAYYAPRFGRVALAVVGHQYNSLWGWWPGGCESGRSIVERNSALPEVVWIKAYSCVYHR